MFHYIKKLFSHQKNSTYLDNFFFEENSIPKAGVENYKNNVIVNRCVNIIAQSVSHVSWVVSIRGHKGIKRDDNHPIFRLLKKPNPLKAGAEFFNDLIANKLLFGNAYILMVGNENAQKELYCLNPNSIEIVIEKNQLIGYQLQQAKPKFYPIEKISNQSRILHLKNYNPTSDLHGLSCLESASAVIDLHNKATKWNHSLLKNGACPSGALVVSGGNYLTQEQFARLKQELYDKYSGSSNAGKPLLLEGGLDWKEMSISPKDMDFIESKNSAAREIALAFGIPPQLLGINGDNTYSNMQEARLALWEETLIPLLDKLSDTLTNWFSYWFNENIQVDFDRDSISVLTDRRQKLWKTLNEIQFMDINEKRAMVGLGPMKNN